MEVVIRHKSMLPLPAAQMWDLLQRTKTLRDVAEGFVTYEGAMPTRFTVDARFDIKPKFQKFPWALLPSGSHIVEVNQVDDSRLLIETLESGGVVSYWNHLMKIHEFKDTRFCMYTDHVIIEAGIFTPLVAKLAHQLYLHRHARWLTLAKAELQAA